MKNVFAIVFFLFIYINISNHHKSIFYLQLNDIQLNVCHFIHNALQAMSLIPFSLLIIINVLKIVFYPWLNINFVWFLPYYAIGITKMFVLLMHFHLTLLAFLYHYCSSHDYCYRTDYRYSFKTTNLSWLVLREVLFRHCTVIVLEEFGFDFLLLMTTLDWFLIFKNKIS